MITELLGRLAKAGIGSRIVVLRNSEDLPRSFSGTDLDVSVLPGQSPADVVDWMAVIARATGWRVVLTNARPHIAGLSIHHPKNDVALHFDVFDGVSAYGMNLMTPEDLAVESFDQGGFSVLSPRAEVAVTLLHHLSWNGCLNKEKYRETAKAVLRTDPDWLLHRMSVVWGVATARSVADEIVAGSLGEGGRRRRRRLLVARLRCVGISAGVKGVAQYWLSQAGSLRHPAGVVGRPGAPLPADPDVMLSGELACEVAPHSIIAPSVRSPVSAISNLNGPRYESAVQATWSRWTLVRWIAPSIFVWYLAKRGRVVVLDRPPHLLAVFARRGWQRDWIAG